MPSLNTCREMCRAHCLYATNLPKRVKKIPAQRECSWNPTASLQDPIFCQIYQMISHVTVVSCHVLPIRHVFRSFLVCDTAMIEISNVPLAFATCCHCQTKQCASRLLGLRRIL